ncbi:hypothetical protein HPP92_001146 [Vanilla planifolia]|uniref:Uncharacterized protein n=1 Tax=Vanilla planifolia TaxID=51239 RepID=A0A835VGT8_VANPL|nr:hypothetical protein HPP92_001304 [Vanilla planifolia]KAG0501074.1 hypothetical protein HPP92_001146 [Vanilla planifolia]
MLFQHRLLQLSLMTEVRKTGRGRRVSFYIKCSDRDAQKQFQAMSSCNNTQFSDLPNQLGYVQCGFCTTFLLVSVPCSSLLKVVTVKCGHCSGLLSVSLVRNPTVPLQLLASLDLQQEKQAGSIEEEGEGRACEGEEEAEAPSKKDSPPPPPPPPPSVISINKPPEKRQRAPSAYNRFIKEEIQRIKSRDPSITHKEAFSTAAKNWAHFPRFQHREKGEGCSVRREGRKERDEEAMDGRRMQGFRERKALRHVILMDSNALPGFKR